MQCHGSLTNLKRNKTSTLNTRGQRLAADLYAVQIGFLKRLFRAEYKKEIQKSCKPFTTESFFSLTGSLTLGDDKQTLN